jgi:hypothetical protein
MTSHSLIFFSTAIRFVLSSFKLKLGQGRRVTAFSTNNTNFFDYNGSHLILT